jgi:signal transduction histidine kinase
MDQLTGDSGLQTGGAHQDKDRQWNPEENHRQSNLIRNQFLLGRLIGEVNRKLSSGQNYEQILDFIFDALNIIIPFDRIGIALLEPENQLRLSWVRSKVPTIHLKMNYAASILGSSLESIVKTGQPRIISDLVEYSRNHPDSASTKLILSDGIRSSLTCPLMAHGKMIGIVFFSSCLPGTYEHLHVQIFSEIAEELSTLVEQGQLQNYFSRDAAKARNLGMILHDLKSPLSIIDGFLEMALVEDWYEHLSPRGKQVLSVLKRNSGYMSMLIEELSQLSQVGSVLDRRSVNLKEFTSEICNHGQFLSERKSIQFKCNIDPHLSESASFDAEKIRRVINNLLTNAVKFSNRGSEICLLIKVTEDRLSFSVADQGQGIKAEELQNIFKEFGKTSTRPTEGEESTGLGLAIAKQLVELHGGQISVESKINQGSTFSFWIPLGDSAFLH